MSKRYISFISDLTHDATTVKDGAGTRFNVVLQHQLLPSLVILEYIEGPEPTHLTEFTSDKWKSANEGVFMALEAAMG